MESLNHTFLSCIDIHYLYAEIRQCTFHSKKILNRKNGTSNQQQTVGDFVQNQLPHLLHCFETFLRKRSPVFSFLEACYRKHNNIYYVHWVFQFAQLGVGEPVPVIFCVSSPGTWNWIAKMDNWGCFILVLHQKHLMQLKG